MTDLLLHDTTREYDDGSGTRTLVYDVPAPWLLHGLFRSEAYVSHRSGQATVTVSLVAEEGYATGMVVPSDGRTREERSFDDYFSGGESRPHDKAAITFRTDVHEADAVVPDVHRAAEHASEIRGERQ